jgi:hypothetical protein
MKRYAFLIIITFALSYTLFGQYFDYISLGYNTVQHTNLKGEIASWYNYFLNDERFSKMQINYNFEESDPLFIERNGIKIRDKTYNGVVFDHFMEDSSLNSFEMEEGYEFLGDREIYRVINGKLVYVELGAYVSKKIEYTDTGITVTMEEKKSYRGSSAKKRIYLIQFYNIPENELYDTFMKYLIKSIYKGIYHADSKKIAKYKEYIKKLTKTELEIFKNCLLAKYDYSFENSTWAEFMRKYDYFHNEKHSITEAMDKFRHIEKDLMEIIQKNLADRYFVIGDYYKTKDNLRLRNKASISGNIILVIKENEWVTVLEEGKTETIDDVTSAWVKIKLQDNTTGWCFGGYLGY